jgi:hypothetical protein
MSVQQFVGSFKCYPQIVAAVKKHEKTLDQLAYVDVKTELHVPNVVQVVELRLVFRDGSIVYENGHGKPFEFVPLQKTDEEAMNEDGDTNWQPIETAPVNERVLVFVPITHHRLVIALQTEYGVWLREDLQPMSYPPTRWMNLPTPPKDLIG